MKYYLSDSEVSYNKEKVDAMCTVYVPTDCDNNCSFCTSKALYQKCSIDYVSVLKWMMKFSRSKLTEIVFTGGEPTKDISLLRSMVTLVGKKNVYINTELPKKNCSEFIRYVNTTPQIKGINISRHVLDEKKQKPILADDKQLEGFRDNLNIRINVVIDDNFNPESICEYESRYSKLGRNIDITFREDYNSVTPENLHYLSDNHGIMDYLTANYRLQSEVYCHVCHKFEFKRKDGRGLIRYHRGLANTRVKIGNIVEMQELVLCPDGTLHTDWDGTDDGLEEYMKILQIR